MTKLIQLTILLIFSVNTNLYSQRAIHDFLNKDWNEPSDSIIIVSRSCIHCMNGVTDFIWINFKSDVWRVAVYAKTNSEDWEEVLSQKNDLLATYYLNEFNSDSVFVLKEFESKFLDSRNKMIQESAPRVGIIELCSTGFRYDFFVKMDGKILENGFFLGNVTYNDLINRNKSIWGLLSTAMSLELILSK